MPFVSLASLRGQHVGDHHFRVAVEKRGVTFRPGAIAIGKLGWKRGDRIDVQVGDGPDAGSVRLAPAPDGWSLVSAGGGSNSLSLKISSKLIVGAPDTLPSTGARSLLDGAAVIVWLPWAAASEIRSPAPSVEQQDPARPGAVLASEQFAARNAASDRRGEDGDRTIPVSAAVVDPEPKPPEARIAEAVDGAGSSSETRAEQTSLRTEEQADPTLRTSGKAGATPVEAVEARQPVSEPRHSGSAGQDAECPGAADHESTGPAVETTPSAGGVGFSSRPATGVSFLVQQRSLAEIESPDTMPYRAGPPTPRKPIPAATGPTNDPDTWNPDVRQRFIAAAERGDTAPQLAVICGRKAGSVYYIIERYFGGVIDLKKRQAALAAKTVAPPTPTKISVPATKVAAPPVSTAKPAPAKAAPAPQTPKPAPRSAPPAPASEAPPPEPEIGADVLKFLRDEVVPVLAPYGRKVTKNARSTGLLLDDKPATLDEIVEEVNRLMRLADEPEIGFTPAEAAA